MSDQEPAPDVLLLWVAIAIWTFGIVIAVGSYWLNHNIYRPLVVLACVALFQGFWKMLLSTRRKT